MYSIMTISMYKCVHLQDVLMRANVYTNIYKSYRMHINIKIHFEIPVAV